MTPYQFRHCRYFARCCRIFCHGFHCPRFTGHSTLQGYETEGVAERPQRRTSTAGRPGTENRITMAPLTLCLFGSMHIEIDGAPLTASLAKKELWVLALLALR